MGNSNSLDQINLDVRVKEKLLSKEYKKCLNDEAREIENVKKALEKGNKQLAKFHAENALRKKNQSIKILQDLSQLTETKTNSKVFSKSSHTNYSNNLSNTAGFIESKTESNNIKPIEITDSYVDNMISRIALESDIDLESYLKITNVIK